MEASWLLILKLLNLWRLLWSLLLLLLGSLMVQMLLATINPQPVPKSLVQRSMQSWIASVQNLNPPLDWNAWALYPLAVNTMRLFLTFAWVRQSMIVALTVPMNPLCDLWWMEVFTWIPYTMRSKPLQTCDLQAVGLPKPDPLGSLEDCPLFRGQVLLIIVMSNKWDLKNFT